ncbi:MAG: glycosyltransferase family 4 protein [Puniceicoccales bacterium]|jgi:glycosyltransferase involved in cell wall biosynthesis|nr:glycosyltransferase family 4 protein [Puniceicoccales bacterium]
MRILNLLHSRNFAGTEQMVLTLAHALEKTGKCEVFTAVKNKGILRQKYKDAGLRVLDIPTNGFFAKKRLAAWTRENKIDLIHTHLTGAARTGLWLHEKTGIPLVVHLHLTKNSPAYRKAAHAGTLIAISAHVARFYEKTAGIAPEKILHIPNATPVLESQTAARPRKECAAQIRREFQLPENARIFTLTGRVSPEKGHETLLRAMPAILAKHPGTHTLIIGNLQQKPAYARKLKKITQNLSLQKNIHFTGFRENILHYVRAADAQLVLSENEPFGLVLIEAMALGTPIIATNTGAIPEILENNTLGTLIPYGDATALSTALIKILENNTPFEEKAEHAKKRAQTLYSPETLAQNTLQLYEKLVLENCRKSNAAHS